MRHRWTGRAARWLAMLLLALVSALALAAPARAAARIPQAAGDTVTLSIDNGTTFTYGGTPTPSFTAVVALGSPPTAGYFWQVFIQIDDGSPKLGNADGGTFDPNTLTITFTRIMANAPIAAGQRMATASFFNPGTGTTVTSPPVSFTVNQAPTDLSCNIDGTPPNFVAIGQTLHVHMSPTSSSRVPGDWQNGTYGVTLDGPSPVNASNFTLDDNGDITVPGPSQTGQYTLGCTFSGTTSFASATFTGGNPYTFSAMHSLGTVQLFTNPTTVTAGQGADFYIVFHAAPGLPLPTGQIMVYMGQYFSGPPNPILLSSNGDVLIHFAPLPPLGNVSNITVRYFGDENYGPADTYFPLTNPPIPGTGSGSSGGSGSHSGQATATPKGAAGPAATGTADAATPTTVGSSTGAGASSPPSRPSRPGSNSGPFLFLVVILLILFGQGVAGGILIYVKRRARVPATAADSLPLSDAPAQVPVLPEPSNADTSPVP